MAKYEKISRMPKTIPEDIETRNLDPEEIAELIEEYGEENISM